MKRLGQRQPSDTSTSDDYACAIDQMAVLGRLIGLEPDHQQSGR